MMKKKCGDNTSFVGEFVKFGQPTHGNASKHYNYYWRNYQGPTLENLFRRRRLLRRDKLGRFTLPNIL
jgi:hypothetical protein